MTVYTSCLSNFIDYNYNYIGNNTIRPLDSYVGNSTDFTTGIGIGVIEILLYLFTGFLIRRKWYDQLKSVNVITYYWLLMTVLTFIWEISFILQYTRVHEYAQQLIDNDAHVWYQNYTFDFINPWKVAKIFYAEYGAHADREYIHEWNYWSRLIEGSHAFLCGLFSLLALIFVTHNKKQLFVISATVAMATQLMNSILYMGQYFIQVGDPYSVNFPSSDFPCGLGLSQRGFMYVNVFWTIMPLYVITMEYILYTCRYKQEDTRQFSRKNRRIDPAKRRRQIRKEIDDRYNQYDESVVYNFNYRRYIPIDLGVDIDYS